MKQLLSLLCVALVLAGPAWGQSLQQAEPLVPAGTPYQLHVTHLLAQTPQARQSIDEYKRLKALGQLSTLKTTANPPEIGDRQTFRVPNLDTNQTESIEFELRAEAERFYVWVEVAELDNGNASDDDVQGLLDALANRTSESSFDPTKGIIELNEIVFGEPPDIDGDGKTDVLLLDVRDGYDPLAGNRGYVGGFVTAADLGGGGNRRDILYLDTFPALDPDVAGIEDLASTAAHEYQHLIHLNYDLDELSFINEGLSEWAEIVTGHEGRRISYLADPGAYNTSLFRWSGNSNPNVFEDYQRGGLFITYLAERLGVLDTGALTRLSLSGTRGLQRGLDDAGPGNVLADLIADFHAANFLNDTDLDARYGYTVPQRTSLRAVAGLSIDGRTAAETPSTSVGVAPGAAQFLVWNNVTDLVLTANARFGSPASSSVRPLLVTEQGDVVEVRSLALGPDATTLEGAYERVALVLSHTDPDGATESVEYSATWDNEEVLTAEAVQYDNGQVRNQNGFVLSGGAELLTRFDNPSPGFAFLGKALLPVYYYSQFQGGPPQSSTRDFRFIIRDVAEDGTPGEELFAVELEDPRGYTGVTSFELQFAEVDLGSFRREMEDLPNRFFMGFADVDGTNDANTVVLAASPYAQENLSYLGPTQSGWAALWDIELSSGATMDGTILPIRAEFLVSSQPVSDEDGTELPGQIALAQNYPNPFNPATTIEYGLPQTGPVSLKVFDLLGREVVTLVDGVQPAGTHRVTLEAGDWASGLYFYTIEAGGQQQTRRMVLLK